jgi:hypothetical protein
MNKATLPDTATLPFGSFDLNKRGTILKYQPTMKYKGKGTLTTFVKSVVSKNFFRDIAPYTELLEFDYLAFLNDVWLNKVFDLADGVKVTFLRVNSTLSIVLMPKPHKIKDGQEVKPPRPEPISEIVRKKLKELDEVEPVFSIRDGKIGFTTRVVRDELLTISQAAKARGVTPQAINHLVRIGRLNAVEIAGKRYISHQDLESFRCQRCAKMFEIHTQRERATND